MNQLICSLYPIQSCKISVKQWCQFPTGDRNDHIGSVENLEATTSLWPIPFGTWLVSWCFALQRGMFNFTMGMITLKISVVLLFLFLTLSHHLLHPFHVSRNNFIGIRSSCVCFFYGTKVHFVNWKRTVVLIKVTHAQPMSTLQLSKSNKIFVLLYRGEGAALIFSPCRHPKHIPVFCCVVWLCICMFGNRWFWLHRYLTV